MFGSVILEVGLGLILVYLLLGLICTAVNELLAQVFRLRAQTLAEGIRNILADPEAQGLAKLFYEHPLIKAFYRDGDRPSYIPSQAFAMTVMDLVTKDHSTQFDKLEAGVNGLGNEKIKSVLRVFLGRAEGKVENVQEHLEQWFNDATERVSGWYKRRIQFITLLVAGSVAGFSNADTVDISQQLSRNSVLRAAVVAQAETVARQSTALTVGDTKESLEKLQGVGLEIGWKEGPPQGALPWMIKIFGLLLTTLAASLGAPFWFDMLNKVIRLRSSVAARTAEEKS
ncbi:hypothetical protein HUU05_27110 [candidate division KSB1 bacterium]|nr:hypothetical protein [candidate division KSB1 bacterium]